VTFEKSKNDPNPPVEEEVDKYTPVDSTEIKEFKDLNSLRVAAISNTKAFLRLKTLIEEATKLLKDTSVLRERLRLRQLRQFKLVRRRNELIEEENRKNQKRQEKEQNPTLDQIEIRKKQLVKHLIVLAQDCENQRIKANGNGDRPRGAKLQGLINTLGVVITALEKAPKITGLDS